MPITDLEKAIEFSKKVEDIVQQAIIELQKTLATLRVNRIGMENTVKADKKTR